MFRKRASLLEELKEVESFKGPLGVWSYPIIMRLLAGQPKPEKPVEEWEKMPDDYVGDWNLLTTEQKKAIYEALRHNRKIYVAKFTEESQRGMLDSQSLERQRIKRILESEW